MNGKTAIGAAVIIAFPVLYGLIGIGGVAYRDDLDVFGRFMSSPLDLLLPLVAVFLTCVGTYSELGNRFIANLRTRVDVRKFIRRRLLVVLAVSFVTFFLSAFVPFVVAFYVWPAIGNPEIAPQTYNMTVAQAIADSYTRHIYTSLLQQGDATFGLVYSALIGAAGAAFAGLGLSMLLLLKNRVLAFAIPFILFFVETIAASVLGVPQFGLLYGLFPFGLQAMPAWQALAPLIAICVAVIVLWSFTLSRSKTLPNLA